MYSSSTVPATGLVTSISGDNISGTYTSSLGGGTFALSANPNLYARTPSLAKLEGVWVDHVFTYITGTTTWVIETDGSYTISSTSGCTATGAFSLIDPTKNEYSLTMVIANCTGYDGSYTGIAAINDTFNVDDTISLIFSNGSVGGLSQPIKQ